MIRFLWLVLLGSGLTILKAQGTLNCGKYPTVSTEHGNICRRNGILHWFAGIPGIWETELRLGAGGDSVHFSIGDSSLSVTSYGVNLVMEDSRFGSTMFSEAGVDLLKYGSNWTRILGVCYYSNGQCQTRDATGALWLAAEAQNAAALDAVSAFGVYRHISNGSTVSQTTAPVTFMDQGAVRWTAIITETPRDLQSQPGASVTSFAVANLSLLDRQAVLVRVYGERGDLVASAKTAVLDQALGDSIAPMVVGVYADTFSNLLGISLPVSSCTGCASPGVFRGTVVIEGDKGGPIAPVVFRFNGPALTTVPVRAE